MTHHTYLPSPALSPFIEFYRTIELEGNQYQSLSFLDYPRTAMDIVFCFDGQPVIAPQGKPPFTLSPSTFIGNFDRAYQIRFSKKIALLNIRFKANGVYPLTQLPLQELLNSHIELGHIFSSKNFDLHEQLATLNSAVERIKLIEQYLLPIYQSGNIHYRFDQALHYINQSRGLMSVSQLANQLNTNYKSLDRWFQKKVGLPPKKFLQLTRFKHILAALENQQQHDWISLADDYGFYDQAHFIKTFKRFAGCSPTQFQQLTHQQLTSYNMQSE